MLETSTENKKIEWPPSYTIRKSLRARRPFLQIIPVHGLEIVIPSKQKSINIHTLLTQKRAWIEKMLLQMKDQLTTSFPEQPNAIHCKALGETWQVIYEPLPHTKKITLIAHSFPQKIIVLTGNTENRKLCYRILTRWLIKYAHIFLIPWIKNLSTVHELFYNKIIIRGQSTLWGSCNAKKNISLNYKLLFLPPGLVQHVLLHELCHTKYLNHSTRFWQYLKMRDPNCIENKKALKKAECYLPPWLYHL